MTGEGPLRGALFLLLASTLWGCAFIPQAISVEHMGPLWATALRFLIAAPVACLFAGRSLRASGGSPKAILVLGVLLYVAFYLQTAALQLTPVWRVSLITGTYAAFTPLLAPWFGLPRPTPLHWLGVALAMVGLGLLVVDPGASTTDGAGPLTVPSAVPLNLGDLMTLGHALLSSVHLILIGRLAATARPRALNALQLVVMAVCAVTCAALLEPTPGAEVFDGRTWLAFGYLAVFSSTVAFGAQIAGQRTASPPAAAVIMLLEAPIGASLAIALFDEVMRPGQLVGALFLMLGVGASVFGDLRRARRGRPT